VGKNEKCIQNFGQRQLGDLDVDGMITLGLILRKVRVCTGFVRLRKWGGVIGGTF
jgi:hypothetical protein